MESTKNKKTNNSIKGLKYKSELAKILGYELKYLTYLAYKVKENDKYKTISIPKKNGGSREINIPSKHLRNIQKKIAYLIQESIEYNDKAPESKQNLYHGFVKGKSIFTNAKIHKNKKFIFNIDINDFFESINFGRVRGVLMKNQDLSLSHEVASFIAHIACRDQKLPQGSPLSPILSNMIGAILDRRLSVLAHKNGCSYSRYADDITFSTNKKEFPKAIAKKEAGQDHVWSAGDSLINIIKKSGFIINDSKTRMQYKNSRQEVTGLVVNKKVNTRNEYRSMVRVYVNNLINKGEYFISTSNDDKKPGTINQLQGMISHIIQAKNNDSTYDSNKTRMKGMELCYKKFAIYSRFFKTESVLIICEGKTDKEYIKSAIIQKRSEFPLLFDKEKNRVAVSFHNMKKFNKNGINKAVGITSGGTGNLGNFIDIYKTLSRKFKYSHPSKNPVIIILDNDDAGKKTLNNALEKGDKKRNDKFAYYLYHNLYAVIIPCKPKENKNENESCVIESLFDEQTKNGFINEKGHFIDSKKTIFSRYVKTNIDKIDFSGFIPLLKEIEFCITDCENRQLPQPTEDKRRHQPPAVSPA